MNTSLIAQQYFQRYKSQLPWAVAGLVLLFTFIVLISDLSYFSFHLRSEPAIRQYAPPVDLASQHLFGLFSDNFDDLPETQLQLKLQGTGVDAKHPQYSSAIISSPDGKARLYHIGDNIPGDAMIKDILFDRIVIDNNGELQKLSMHVPTLQNQPPSTGLPPDSGLSQV